MFDLFTKRKMPRIAAVLLVVFLCHSTNGEEKLPVSAEAVAGDRFPLWPARPPGDEALSLPPESDETKPTDRLIAGRKIIKLANVSAPTLEVFRPEKAADTGTAVVICPGGAYRILAYDLEGTEVAKWLTGIGVTGIVLKYRVPARKEDERHLAAVQDAQRAMSLVRHKAGEWGLNPNRIGICGFSAGGDAACRLSLASERMYAMVDDADRQPFRPDFAMLIYPGYLAEKDGLRLREDLKVTKGAPPMFLVHAFDDPVTPLSSTLLFNELKRAGVPADLHVFDRGGHGYGLRPTELPVTHWPARCEEWLRTAGLLTRADR